MSTFHTTIERGETSPVTIPVKVHYTYHKGCKETWGYYGGTPSEPESVEIDRVVSLHTRNDLDLSDSEESALEQEALKDVAAEYDSAMEDKSERQAEQREWNRNNPTNEP